MIECAADLIAITNVREYFSNNLRHLKNVQYQDMHSYGLEYSRGLDGHNVITVIMHEYHLNLQGALYWLSGYASKTISKFFSDQKNLPTWGPTIDEALKVHFDRVGRCVRGYDAWSYETKRYYGENGLKVQKSRKITLKPRDEAYITKDQLQASMA